MMKTNSMIALVSFLTLGFAGVGIAHAGEGAATRGQVHVGSGAVAKAVVVGPTAIHAYSAFSGSKLFVVDVVSGTDRDCEAGARGAGSALAADRVETLTVRAGQMACVASTGERPIELLWHAQKGAPASLLLAASR
jgi:hypothetical protein